MERNELPYRRYVFYIVLFLLLSLGVYAILTNLFQVERENLMVFEWPLHVLLLLATWACLYAFFDTYRLYVLTNVMSDEEHISFWRAFKITMIHHFVSNITPFTAGGSISTIYLLKRSGIALPKAMSITTVRAFMGSIVVLTLLPFAVLGIPLMRYQIFVLHPSPIVWGVVGVSYLTVLVAFYSVLYKADIWVDFINRFWAMLYKRGWILPDKYIAYRNRTESGLSAFSKSIRDLFKYHRLALLKVIFASVGYVVTLLLISVILFVGFEYEGNTFVIMGLQLIAQFSMYLGFTPGGLGFAEGSYAWIFSEYLGHDRIMSLVFMWRLMTSYIWVTLGGFSLLLEFRKIRRGK